MSNSLLALLLGASFGLAGGLVVSRLGLRKGYGQLPFFVFGFVAVFVLSFLPVIVFVFGAVVLVAVMTKLPYKSRRL